MPKLSTFRTLPYTAKVFNYRDISGGGQVGDNTREFFFLKDIKLDLSTGMFGRITIFFGEDGRTVMPAARLEQLKDKNGLELYPGGIWTLNGIMPVVTMFGTAEGFQAEARLTHETVVS